MGKLRRIKWVRYLMVSHQYGYFTGYQVAVDNILIRAKSGIEHIIEAIWIIIAVTVLLVLMGGNNNVTKTTYNPLVRSLTEAVHRMKSWVHDWALNTTNYGLTLWQQNIPL